MTDTILQMLHNEALVNELSGCLSSNTNSAEVTEQFWEAKIKES